MLKYVVVNMKVSKVLLRGAKVVAQIVLHPSGAFTIPSPGLSISDIGLRQAFHLYYLVSRFDSVQKKVAVVKEEGAVMYVYVLTRTTNSSCVESPTSRGKFYW